MKPETLEKEGIVSASGQVRRFSFVEGYVNAARSDYYKVMNYWRSSEFTMFSGQLELRESTVVGDNNENGIREIKVAGERRAR